MKQLQKYWLNTVPWESVLALNQALCQAQKTEHKPTARGYEPARQLWAASVTRNMTLAEVLEICRKCFQFAPFAFNNGNTFAAIGKTLVEEWLKTLSPVEAQIMRTTVGHYVAGMVGKKELMTILSHFETWSSAAARPQPASHLIEEGKNERVPPPAAKPAPIPSIQPSH
ncbi:MAG: hypothetical protein L0Y58_25970 [Verrucomicrobia subdivision 3 bacterium]|nr:hypothetical protein [Limisphaerales bacterium]